VDITFGYSPLDAPLIENFSLTLAPGQRIALVGMSGSGKSTIARLICGLYRPWQGQILLGGVPLHDIPEDVLCESFGYADSATFFYEGTVKENLTFWSHTLSQNAILRAAKDAIIHEDIASRPDGYDGWISENGRNFSGGQLQRMEIARALVRNPTCVVLDEATSALDAITEYQIDMNIRRRGCSCLVIAHRLSTVRDANEIIVMKNGKIEERGIHDTLMAKKGIYAKLVK
jgi:ABC-type bacteriocin/lantibiotic exporter with double-glycine peptidase domain